MLELGDRLFRWLRREPLFLRFTLFTRILLAAGFIPTGLVKLLGRRFTSLPVETPIGAFFEATYQTGLYWQVIGAGQVLAGLVLLVPRFARLGASLFLPIMTNIFVITVSLGFGAMAFVAGPMLLAVLSLCDWDGHRARGLLGDPLTGPVPPRLELDRLERAGLVVFALSLLAFFTLTRGFLPGALGLLVVAVGLAAGLLTLVRFLTTGRRLRPAAA